MPLKRYKLFATKAYSDQSLNVVNQRYKGASAAAIEDGLIRQIEKVEKDCKVALTHVKSHVAGAYAQTEYLAYEQELNKKIAALYSNHNILMATIFIPEKLACLLVEKTDIFDQYNLKPQIMMWYEHVLNTYHNKQNQSRLIVCRNDQLTHCLRRIQDKTIHEIDSVEMLYNHLKKAETGIKEYIAMGKKEKFTQFNPLYCYDMEKIMGLLSDIPLEDAICYAFQTAIMINARKYINFQHYAIHESDAWESANKEFWQQLPKKDKAILASKGLHEQASITHAFQKLIYNKKTISYTCFDQAHRYKMYRINYRSYQ